MSNIFLYVEYNNKSTVKRWCLNYTDTEHGTLSLCAMLPSWQIHMNYIATLPIRLYLSNLAF